MGKAEPSFQEHVACRFSVGNENVGWTNSCWPCGLCFHIGGDAIDVGLCCVDGSRRCIGTVAWGKVVVRYEAKCWASVMGYQMKARPIVGFVRGILVCMGTRNLT